MKTMAFEGASDDLVEIDGDPNYDELSYLGSSQPWECVVYDVESLEGLVVQVYYTSEGTWAVGVAIYDEDKPAPSWPIRVLPSEMTRYSMRLEIDVPDTARITQMNRGDND